MKKSSFLTPLALASLVLAACGGGGDNARDVLSGSDDTTVATDAAPATTDAPVVTEPPTTDAPTTTQAPETTAAPATTAAPVDATGDLAAFCGASEQFYVEAKALNSIDGDADTAARTLFADMSVSVSGAIFNAPTPEIAAAPQAMQDVLATLLPALDAVDYDIDAVNDLANADEVNAAFGEFGAIVDQLETFVVAECASDLTALETAAAAKGAEVSNAGLSDPADPTAPTTVAEPVADDGSAVVVTDNSATVSVSVPASWNDVDGAPDGELRQLVAAPDVAAFLAGFNAPGVIIVTGDAPAGNGAEAGAAGLEGLAGSVEADGCVLGQSVPYDDGVYSGTESTYSCPGTDAVARFAGGSNADGSIFWLLGVVYEPADATVWDLITASFLVD